MNIPKALEMARCAEVNIDNLIKVNPFIANHPFTQMVRIQIHECIKHLEEDEPGFTSQ